MSNVTQMQFRYFSPVEGRVVQRFGTDAYIGASRGPKGFAVNPDAVVAIPVTEITPRLKTWRNLVSRGDLVERTEQDFVAWQGERKRRTEVAVAARKKKQADDAEEAKRAADDVAAKAKAAADEVFVDDEPETQDDTPTAAPPPNDPPQSKPSGKQGKGGGKKGGGKGRR